MQRLTLQDLEKLAKRFESDPWTEKAAAAPLLLENLREALKEREQAWEAAEDFKRESERMEKEPPK